MLYSFTTETCCEHTKHTGFPFTSVKKWETDQMSWKTVHSLSNFHFFDKDILGNEAATE